MIFAICSSSIVNGLHLLFPLHFVRYVDENLLSLSVLAVNTSSGLNCTDMGTRVDLCGHPLNAAEKS